MQNNSTIYHYTNIRTLSLILKYKTLRFNRLDHVDDVSEAKIYGEYGFARNIFVSCWTDCETESIPQWHMYTNQMAGVRISLPKDLFNYRPLSAPASWNAVSSGTVLSPIPMENLFHDKYIIIPNFFDKNNFERKVQYVDDLSHIYDNAVEYKKNSDGTVNLQIKRINDFASYKHKVWEFQSEFRFVLFILPGIPIPENGIGDPTYNSQLPSVLMNSIINKQGPDLDYFDVDINPNVLDNIEVTMGPLSNEADQIMVEAMLKQYTKYGRIKHSSLSGTIRKPIR